jgi:tyrosine-protein kinase Etk/Wzc
MPNRPKTKNTPFAEELLLRYQPYWPLFLTLAIIFSLAALAYVRYATPHYEVSATLLISDEKKGSEEISVSESLNLLNSKKIVENEVVVLQSRNLLDAVVRNLYLYAPVSEEGRVSDRSAYTSSPVVVTAPQPDQLKPSAKRIPLTYDAANRIVQADGRSYPLNVPVQTPWGTLQFVANPHFHKAGTQPLYFRLLDPKSVAAGLSKQLDVTAAGKLSSIVKLKLRDEVPERGEDIVNQLIENYNRSGIDYKNAIARNTIAFVDARMRIVQRELNTVEKQIQTYKSSKGIVDLSEQGKLYLKNVGENDQHLSDLNMKLSVLDQVERYVVSRDASATIAPATLGVADPLLSDLLEKLYQAELDRDRLSKTTAENHPSMVALNDQIERMRPSILENIRSQRRGLQASLRDLTATNQGYNSMLQTIPQKERELLDVSRQQSIKNSIYSFLLQKREETAIGSASNIADSKVVETARASLLPVSPNKPFILMVALIAALAAGVVYVVLRESLSQKLLFRSDLESYTSVPVAGEIAYAPGSPLRKNATIEEQLRHLRVASGLFSKASKKKKILVTSSLEGEGKTFIAERLAVSLSLSGKKVVLINTDLRPTQVTHLKHTGTPTGLAEFLEEETEPYEIIKGTDYKNLFVIPAGTTDTQATELLLNGKLNQLFDYLEETFDFIIMDAAAVGSATDAFILAEWSDLTYYVVRHAHTPKSVIRTLDDAYPVKGLPNLAIVFNAVKQRGFFTKGNGYGYGFGVNSQSQVQANTTFRSIRTLLQQLQSTLRKPLLKKA